MKAKIRKEKIPKRLPYKTWSTECTPKANRLKAVNAAIKRAKQ